MSFSKTALVIGISGQDGQLLKQSLLRKQCRVVGLGRSHLEDSAEICTASSVDITKPEAINSLLSQVLPDDVYYLAAYHHSSQETQESPLDLFTVSQDVHVTGLLNFLEGIRLYSKRTRLFYAASSLVFGANEQTELLSESSLMKPDSIYGITKHQGILSCQFYRKQYDIFASSGILFNHESSFRADKFLSKKLVKAAVDISKGRTDPLVLGNLSSVVDWSAAEDFVEAFQCILGTDVPDDFVIASGIGHSVAEFAEIAFKAVGLRWQEWVKEDSAVIKRVPVPRIGNAQKLKNTTGWNAKISFEEMVQRLVSNELKLRSDK